MNKSHIPLKIFQVLYNKALLSAETNELISAVRTRNPEFAYCLFDIDDCKIFIEKNFSQNILKAYNALIPLAYKNNLWSLCVLYKYGGIYLDLSMTFANDFKLYTLTDQEYFAADIKLNEYPNDVYKGVCTDIICCKPHNPILLKAIEQITENVDNNFYGGSPLDPTGSVLLGKFFSDDDKQNMVIKRTHDHRGDGFSINNTLILKRRNISEYQSFNFICDWHNRNIYQNLHFSRNLEKSAILSQADKKSQADKNLGLDKQLRGTTYLNNEEIIYITAFKDISRVLWKTFQRSNDEYFNCFFLLANNFDSDQKLVVFVDSEVREELLRKNKFNSNIIFCNFDSVNSFYKKYLQRETEVLDSNIFKQKVPSNRLYNNPETWCAKYNLINHSKINFIRHVKTLYPHYKYYSWIDFGFVKNHDLNVIPKAINPNKIKGKITYQYKYMTSKVDANEILRSNNDYIVGSAFIVPNEVVEWFETKYEEKLNNWYSNYIADDDQSLVLQLYFDYKDMFNLIQDYGASSLYKHLC